MPLTTRAVLELRAEQTSALDLASGSVPLPFLRQFVWLSGTGANQADRIFHDERTLTASASEDLDLAGSLVDGFGATITFARVKMIAVYALTTNTNNVVVGNASANGFAGPFGATTHTITIRPGGLWLIAAPDATGYAVTAGTGDLLHVANSGAGTSVIYDIVVIGASA